MPQTTGTTAMPLSFAILQKNMAVVSSPPISSSALRVTTGPALLLPLSEAAVRTFNFLQVALGIAGVALSGAIAEWHLRVGRGAGPVFFGMNHHETGCPSLRAVRKLALVMPALHSAHSSRFILHVNCYLEGGAYSRLAFDPRLSALKLKEFSAYLSK